MAQWQIVGQFDIEADTPDEAIAWLRHQLATRLEPGEEGSPWQEYGKGTPAFVVGAVREVRPDPGVPVRQHEG